MADTLYTFTSEPGVRRDGTELDTPYYADSVWVRWQRGRPRKMGGYRTMTQWANGPVRSVFLDSRGGVNSTHLFSQWGIQRVQFANDGSSGNIEDRTPASFTVDANLNWSHAAMYSSTGGAYSAIIAASSPDVLDIASDTTGYIYAGNIATDHPLDPISDGSGNIRTSGGICVLQPFLFVYGSNGLIRNSNTNDFSTATGWTTGGANFAASNNVAGTKIVYGAPLRGGGQAPAGLFWALDSLIRVSFVGGSALWSYDTLANPTTIMSKKAVVEVDGRFFWPGTDRFLAYNGVVQELPNQMNSNWFFDGLNRTYANKVWGTKVARWGEIWWFYPRGTDTECGHAVIYNYRENTWYDAVKERTAGASTGVFSYPIWAGHEDATETQRLPTGFTWPNNLAVPAPFNLTTSAATLAGSAVLTFTATTGVVDGSFVTGVPGIPANSFVSSHTATTVTLNNVTTGAGVPISSVLTFSTRTISFATAAGAAVGMVASGHSSIPNGATVVSFTPTTVTLNVAISAAMPRDVVVSFTTMTTAFAPGYLVTGGTSGATGTAVRVLTTSINVKDVTGTFVSGETITGIASATASLTAAPSAQTLVPQYQHEYGHDKTVGQDTTAIESSFTSRNFGFAIGAPFEDVPKTIDLMTRIQRFEPDFGQVGDMTVEVQGRSFAQDDSVSLASYNFTPDSSFVNMTQQARILRLKLTSNTIGGFFQQGQVMVKLAPGDERATKIT